MGRWVAYVVFGLIATTVVLATAIFVLLDRFDLGPLAASRASAALGPGCVNTLCRNDNEQPFCSQAA